MAPEPTTTSKKPGRKAMTPTEKRRQAERQLEEAKRIEKQDEERKNAIIGAAMRIEAKSNAGFKKEMDAILRRHVTGKAALANIATLLDSDAPTDTVIDITTGEADTRTAAA